jgi:hypothetical protein
MREKWGTGMDRSPKSGGKICCVLGARDKQIPRRFAPRNDKSFTETRENKADAAFLEEVKIPTLSQTPRQGWDTHIQGPGWCEGEDAASPTKAVIVTVVGGWV